MNWHLVPSFCQRSEQHSQSAYCIEYDASPDQSSSFSSPAYQPANENMYNKYTDIDLT